MRFQGVADVPGAGGPGTADSLWHVSPRVELTPSGLGGWTRVLVLILKVVRARTSFASSVFLFSFTLLVPSFLPLFFPCGFLSGILF